MNDFWNGTHYKKYGIFQEIGALRSLKNFPLTQAKRILDIGCGIGNISKWIADRVPKGKVIGIDPSRHMLSQAISSYKKIPNLEFFCAQAETFQFDEPFDLVTSFHALHFVKNQLEAFKRIKSSLTPKGKILIRIASQMHPTVLEVLDRKSWKSTVHIEDKMFPLSLKPAELILQKVGFTKDQVEIDSNTYLFPTPKKLTGWIMTWISHVSHLTGNLACQLAQEVSELVCFKESRQHDIPLQINTLVIKAHVGSAG